MNKMLWRLAALPLALGCASEDTGDRADGSVASGLAQAEQEVAQVVARFYRNVSVSVSLADVRSFKVFVVGDVVAAHRDQGELHQAHAVLGVCPCSQRPPPSWATRRGRRLAHRHIPLAEGYVASEAGE